MFESIKIHKDQEIKPYSLARQLVAIGYRRCQGLTEHGDFVVRGESALIYPATFEYPVRIEFSGNTVERIVSIDLVSYKSIEEHNALIVLPTKAEGGFRRRRARPCPDDKDPIDSFVDIEVGDYVVHTDYGIGKFLGIKKIKDAWHGEEESVVIEYKDKDVLYVPFSEINKIQKYIYFSRKRPLIHKLGGKRWQKAKERAVHGIVKIAKDLLEVQAKRESLKGHSFSADTDWQKQVEESFPFKETKDQLIATDLLKRDMESIRPMDRLLCGDVGYGKTEVALRAAFKAVMDNKQVAILVPTTILAEQHYATFKDRFKIFPINVEMLSRFRSQSTQKEIIANLKTGAVDVVIGTHRLLSDDISFKDLGLLIIDEEQRFGVVHKEKLKKIRLIVDVLTLTATPIPRTLYLALMGGRDISVINTPPLLRQPVETQIIEYDEGVVNRAIKKELDRKGQVYFVHNRIDNINKVRDNLKKCLPKARIEIGHGRMPEKELEKTMFKFIKGGIDVLVCTTIIQSGIDIPNANTLIVNRAENFGLADLYQLRGRVGRFNRKAYSYFIVARKSALTHESQRRLNAIKKFTKLGSGFKIAMQDLELRGAGNLLGTEQHGYIEQVGFDLYCRLLRNAIESIKQEK
ncbi:MAG: transcription-repair coupling factor [Candidatus Omnitrophica bacterium]|nr:transcription-repair coupling factor [Candidatus Omnitrophota bacterium]